MKKVLLILALLTTTLCEMSAQAEIKFDKTVHDFGTFSESNPVQTCVFTFTNTGTTPLIINQAIAACGCTTPSYTKNPVAPGEKGTIKVKYNGRGITLGQFKKTITIYTNSKTEVVRLYIKGKMEEAK